MMLEPMQSAPAGLPPPPRATVAALCASVHTAIGALIAALDAAGPDAAGPDAAGLARQLVQSRVRCAALAARLASRAGAGEAQSRKRARTAAATVGGAPSQCLLLALPPNLLVDTAVKFVGAEALSRLEVAAPYVRRSGLVEEVARRLRVRRPCWSRLLWRQRDRVRARARGWGASADAVAHSLRPEARTRRGRQGDAGGGGEGGVRGAAGRRGRTRCEPDNVRSGTEPAG